MCIRKKDNGRAFVRCPRESGIFTERLPISKVLRTQTIDKYKKMNENISKNKRRKTDENSLSGKSQ